MLFRSLLGIFLTIPVGLIFAIPALRTRGVNLAVVTLALGFLVSEVVFANPNYLGRALDGGTRIGRIRLFGVAVDAFNHPHAWAAVSLILFVALALVVANLRRSRTGRRLVAVRTNERAAASLGISVFGVKLYAFAVSAGLAATAGILVGFRGQVINYTEFNVFASINSLGNGVIGGIGFALGAVFGAPNAIRPAVRCISRTAPSDTATATAPVTASCCTPTHRCSPRASASSCSSDAAGTTATEPPTPTSGWRPRPCDAGNSRRGNV